MFGATKVNFEDEAGFLTCSENCKSRDKSATFSTRRQIAMSYTKLKSYSANAIGEILPLDRESINEIINFALTLPTDHEIQAHFLNLFGESEDALTFVTKFILLKHEAEEQDRVDSKPPTPLASSTAWGGSPAPEKKKHTKGRLDKSTGSKTVSELLDAKPSNLVSQKQQKKNKKKNVEDLRDIDAILVNLELQNSKKDGRRVCNCNATRHPLFELAPNCLNCGKIICTKEGLQPCLYCGADLLNKKDRLEIIAVLRQEREDISAKQENPGNKKIQDKKTALSKGKGIKYALTAGENLWEAQDKALKKADEEAKRTAELRQKELQRLEELKKQEEALKMYERVNEDADLVKAQERLDTLLNFQATGAERTRIIDNAADFEMPSSSSNSWLLPAERALQLKRQERQQRKHLENKKIRTGRGKRVVEMVIRDGKVSMVEKTVAEDNEDEDNEIEELEDQIKLEKTAGERELSKNVWDYEADKKKWEKPVYRGLEAEKSAENTADELARKKKVQFEYDPDQNELLVEMPS